MTSDADDKASPGARAAAVAAAAAGVAGAQGLLFGEEAGADDLGARRPSTIDLDAGDPLAPSPDLDDDVLGEIDPFDAATVEADLDRLLHDDPVLGTAELDTGQVDGFEGTDTFEPDAFDLDPADDDPAQGEGPEDLDPLG